MTDMVEILVTAEFPEGPRKFILAYTAEFVYSLTSEQFKWFVLEQVEDKVRAIAEGSEKLG